jgi:hypothetical protein
MIEKLTESTGNLLGFKAIGKITKEDYAFLTAEVEAVINEAGTLRLLLDLEEMTGEEAKAWGPDLKFGHEYRKKIEKMASVGDKKWQKWLTAVVDPFYAREAEFFPTADRAAAWEWLQA